MTWKIFHFLRRVSRCYVRLAKNQKNGDVNKANVCTYISTPNLEDRVRVVFSNNQVITGRAFFKGRRLILGEMIATKPPRLHLLHGGFIKGGPI